VLDTNVLVAALLARDRRSPNLRLYRLWGQRRIQLVVSDEIVAEYLAVLTELRVPSEQVERFGHRLRSRSTVTYVRPRRPIRLSRDPSDNPLLAAAAAAEARFLATNDQDLLEIPAELLRPYRFHIVRPAEVLVALQARRP
jgi:putative PIN family toxin of toxin-antitoxin system